MAVGILGRRYIGGGGSSVDANNRGAFVDVPSMTSGVTSPLLGNYAFAAGVRYNWSGTTWVKLTGNVVIISQINAAPLPTPGLNDTALLVVLKDLVIGDETAGIYKAHDDGDGNIFWQNQSASSSTKQIAVIQYVAGAASVTPSLTGTSVLIVMLETVVGDGTAGLYRAADDGLGNIYWEFVG